MINYIFYHSTAAPNSTPDDDRAIVHAAWRANHTQKITGYLVRHGSNYVQWLEGPKGSLDRLYEKLGKDDRHQDLEILASGERVNRVFPSWLMGFLQHDDHLYVPLKSAERVTTDQAEYVLDIMKSHAQRRLCKLAL